MPVLASSYPVARDRTDWVPVAYAGRVGVWVSEDALADLLAGFEQDKGALRVEIVKSRIGQQLAEQTAAAVTKSAESMAWRATWGPALGFLGGVALAVAVVLGGVYAGKALAPVAH